jgi:hypothetical protein
LYEYQAQEDNELSLKEGDRLVEVEKVDEGWWFGVNEKSKISGLFPATYVQLADSSSTKQENKVQGGNSPDTANPIHSNTVNTIRCVALYDYSASKQ